MAIAIGSIAGANCQEDACPLVSCLAGLHVTLHGSVDLPSATYVIAGDADGVEFHAECSVSNGQSVECDVSSLPEGTPMTIQAGPSDMDASAILITFVRVDEVLGGPKEVEFRLSRGDEVLASWMLAPSYKTTVNPGGPTCGLCELAMETLDVSTSG